MNASAPAIPIATATASGTTVRPTSTPSGILVCSGRPFSSSSACAEMPRARKNATSGGREPALVEVRREAGADHDVAQVPGRVGRVQQRDVVAPAARGERVERRPRLGHVRRPQRTVQPPRLRRSRLHVLEAGLAQGGEQPRHRPALVEVADAAAEEAADLVPAGRDRAAGEGQAEVDPDVPGDARERARRDAEVEQRGRRARPQHAGELAQAGGQVVQVAEQVRGGQAVERCVLEGQLLRLRPRPAARGSSRRRAASRRRASSSISGLWSTPTTEQPFCRDELERDGRGAAGDVEHGVVRADRRGARRGSAASVGPGRTRAGSRSGRRSARAAAKRPRASSVRVPGTRRV